MKEQKQERDILLFRIVVIALGLCVLSSLVGAIILAVNGLDTPELLVALGSAAIGGLAGLLAPSPLYK
jgi:hypothetical protein